MSIYRYIQNHADEIYRIVDETYRWRYESIDIYTSSARSRQRSQLWTAHSDLLLSATSLSIEMATSDMDAGEGEYADFLTRLRENFGSYELSAIHSLLQFVDIPSIEMNRFFLQAKFTPISCEDVDVKLECPICYQELFLQDALVLRCNHKFCKSCLFQWIDQRTIHQACGCPMCRCQISEISTSSENHMQCMKERFETEEEIFGSQVLNCIRNSNGHIIS